VYLGTLGLLAVLRAPLGAALEPRRLRRALLSIAALAALCGAIYGGARALFTEPAENVQTPVGLAEFFLKSSIIFPGGGLVGHTAYLGILFLFAVRLWPRVCRAAAAWGPGAMLFLGLAFFFSINAESRHALALWPMVVVLVSRVLDESRWPTRVLAVFAVLSLINSRAWLDLNWNFPEAYFASFVVGMSRLWYAAQALIFLAVAMYLELCWRRVYSARQTEVA
jgi:hypothetical protein